MRFTLLIPVMNEIEGMKAILPRIQPSWVDELLVVDGGNDGSGEYAASLGYKVMRQTSRGLASAYREAVAVAQGDVIITFSPDGNSIPEKIPELTAKMREGYDLVIVSRYLDGASSEDDDTVTAFGNWMFTNMINLAFGASYTDCLVMFRAWKRSVFMQFDRDPGLAGYDCYTSIRCAKLKLKVGEIPGDEPARIGDVRKMQPIQNGLSILRLIAMEKLRRD